jgi:hypothetical protein
LLTTPYSTSRHLTAEMIPKLILINSEQSVIDIDWRLLSWMLVEEVEQLSFGSFGVCSQERAMDGDGDEQKQSCEHFIMPA